MSKYPEWEASPYTPSDYDRMWTEVERLFKSKNPGDMALCARIDLLVQTAPWMMFSEAFNKANQFGRRFRNMVCPHNDGEPGVWLRVDGVFDGESWPSYDDCGTSMKQWDFEELKASDQPTWSVENTP